jgi:hypothetical protein
VAACALYRSLGFVEVAPYRYNPYDDALFLAHDLGHDAPAGEPTAS